MARVTVEDCVEKIPNRYELLLIAAQRAKDISGCDNDKCSIRETTLNSSVFKLFKNFNLAGVL